MNSRHHSMSFSSESEKDDIMPFLDIQICREGGKFATSVYRKPTFSGVYTHFDSFVPMPYKFGMIYTIVYRCFTLCSSFQRFHKELQVVKEIFRKNGYPISFIDRCIKKVLDKIHTPKITVTTVEKQKLLLVLPYLGLVSNIVRKSLFKTFQKTLPACKLNVVFKTKSRLSNFFKFKDRLCKDLTSGIVYKFQCGSCNASYYGQTKRHFKVRVSEHMGVSPLTGKLKAPYYGMTAIREHMLSCDHQVSMCDFSILANANNTYHLEIKESLLIARDKPILNNAIRSVPLLVFN